MRRLHLAAFLLLIITSACGKSLKSQVHDQVRSLSGAELPRENVEVTKITESGDSATAEVTVRTAVKLKKVGDTWQLDQVRLGDRRWESVERIVEAIESSRRSETEQSMQAIGEALSLYRTSTGTTPPIVDFADLIDLLSPRYLDRVIRFDAWDTPFRYRADNSGEVELRSAGPDRKFGNSDDLVITL